MSALQEKLTGDEVLVLGWIISVPNELKAAVDGQIYFDWTVLKSDGRKSLVQLDRFDHTALNW